MSGKRYVMRYIRRFVAHGRFAHLHKHFVAGPQRIGAARDFGKGEETSLMLVDLDERRRHAFDHAIDDGEIDLLRRDGVVGVAEEVADQLSVLDDGDFFR